MVYQAALEYQREIELLNRERKLNQVTDLSKTRFPAFVSTLCLVVQHSEDA